MGFSLNRWETKYVRLLARRLTREHDYIKEMNGAIGAIAGFMWLLST